MKRFSVSGMSCAACSARVEKAVGNVDGVSSCAVNLLTNSMVVDGNATEQEIIRAVRAAGYDASLQDAKNASGKDKPRAEESALEDRETPKLVRRLIASVGFLLALMYLSMGHMMFGLPLPTALDGNPLAVGILQMLLAVCIMVINQKFFINGTKGLIHRSPNMDTLVAMGSAAAFVYSVYALFQMTAVAGDLGAMQHYLHEFYFEASGMILTLITVGKMLETRAKGKTTDAIKKLMMLAPQTATVLRDGVETEIPVENVRIGDIFTVRPGGNIPVDGEIIDGGGAINESALTGESIPIDKTVGDSVSAGTVNSAGFLKCRAIRVGSDTTLSQIIKMVSDASATKAPIAKVADKVSGVFVPIVISIAVITVIIWLIAGQTLGFALARGISVLVISCPCALGLATPVAIMVGSGMGAKNGILFKTAASLESAGRIKTVALDKTGTVTQGKPSVTDIIPIGAVTDEELLRLAGAVEQNSEHPLAVAIMKECSERKIAVPAVADFEAMVGNGVRAKFGEDLIIAGKQMMISEIAVIGENETKRADELANQGKTPLFFSRNGELLGMIAVADVIKDDSFDAIRELREMNIRVVMLTGDNERTAKAIGGQAGVDEVVAGVLPDEKASVIDKLKQDGTVAMVGDGINDAPALTSADIGIAIGTGTDIAIDSADVVLMKSRLSDVVSAIRLGRATLRTIHQNLFWAFCYNVIGIPIAAGLFIVPFGLQLNPMLGALAMSLSSFCVVSNALRLNLADIRGARKNKSEDNKKENIKEEKIMQKTVKIEGMMCPHCSGRVKKVLEELPEVAEAVVSHESANAVITLKEELSDEKIKAVIEAQGYKVL